MPPGGRDVGDPPWDAWRPEEITRRLSGVTAPWCVAAGRALDRACRRDETISMPS